MTKQHFGHLLRVRRQERGWTLKSAAKALGCSIAYLSDVELGRRGPLPVTKIVRLARAMALPEIETRELLALQAGVTGRLEIPLALLPAGSQAVTRLIADWSSLLFAAPLAGKEEPGRET